MFWAINKSTGERVNGIHLIDNPKYQFPAEDEWIADWNEISNAEEIQKKHSEIKVIFVNEKFTINFKGTKFRTVPHFRIPNASKLGINIIPESPEHKLAKNWIYNQLIESNLKLYYSSVNKPFRYVNAINLNELPINKPLISIETNEKDITLKRVDVICPFYFTHPFFGNGINFEIQFSKQRAVTTKKRTFEAAFAGYSICWIGFNDFKKLSDSIIELKSDALKIDSFAAIINYSNKQHIKKLKYDVEKEVRKLDRFVSDIKTELTTKFVSDINKLMKTKEREFINSVSINAKDILELNENIISVKRDLKEFHTDKDKRCPKCKNILRYKEGISKAGNNYKIYDCMFCDFAKFV